jgi:replicative DNA helicase
MLTRRYSSQISEELFTSDMRKFIVEVAKRVFRDSKANLTRNVYEYEVATRVPDKDRSYYLTEWNVIESSTEADDPDAVIGKLQESLVGRQIMDSAEVVVDLIEKGEVERAVTAFKRGAVSINSRQDRQKIVELTDYSHRLQRIRDKQAHPEKYLGIKTGFKTFDMKSGGIFPKELVLIAGITGIGKSTMVKQLVRGILENNVGKNILYIPNEESQDQVETKFDSLFSEIPYLDFKWATISETDIQKWMSTMDALKGNPNGGRVFIKEVPAFTDVTLIEQAYRELETQGIPIHVVIIDHLPHVRPIEKVWDKNDETFKAASDVKQISKDLNVALVIPTQAATEVEEKQMHGKRAGKLDVYGSKGQVHVANTFLIITYKGLDETQTDRAEWERDVYWLVDCKKNRDGPPFWFMAKHLVRQGKVMEVFKDKAGSAGMASDGDVEEVDDALEEADGKSLPTPEPKKESDPTDSVKEECEKTIQDIEKQKVSGESPHEKKMGILEMMRKKRGMSNIIK